MLIATGCGAGHTRRSPSGLPQPLALELRALEPRPQALRARVIAAVNGKRVPRALQEELLSRANAYAEHPSPRTRRAFDGLVR